MVQIDQEFAPDHEFSDVEEFLVAPAPPTGYVRIALNRPPLDFRYLDKGESALGVFFTAAVPNDSLAPRFTGFAVSRNVSMNTINFAGPAVTLTPEIFLAWYTGWETQRLDSVIRKVIQKYREWLGHRTPTLLYGGSAGGCASLVVGLEMDDVVSIAANPQTDLRYYNRPLVQQRQRARWPNAAPVLDEALVCIPAVTDVASAYVKKRGIGVSNRVVILQNIGDADHIDAHFRPLKQALESTGHMRCLLDDWGGRGTSPRPLT
ncbi:hypothetical protein M3E18_10100 [Kocuria sp. p3-SID1433]|uniref:hypothetical protein n=1 Tax=unclassified Kocuria TaxID=2649579 RepID=UPI0021A6C09B|nr:MULTISPECIES: hypothetical protein [unclassified Kocuria]MCT1601381.1 hypothetical protein [Kocuria sp. p3-SID1428]MCT2180878.1 hypothetical protein [Kocuria sp. p3-SID1433]